MPEYEDGWSGRTRIKYGTWTGQDYHDWRVESFPERHKITRAYRVLKSIFRKKK